MIQNKSTTFPKPRRSLRAEIVLAICLASLIVVSRWTIDLPNFKPVMAVAMLAGFLFHRRGLGIATTIAGLMISDAFIGFYDWRVALVVYFALLCPIVCGVILQKWKTRSIKMSAGILGFSGLAALNFYLLTTLAVWICFDWYPATISGLGAALLMGLPFLKWTLMGNIVFSIMLFGIADLARWASQLSQVIAGKRFVPARESSR